MRFFDYNKHRLNQLPIAEGIFFTGHYRPCLISFKDTAIVRILYLDEYQRSFLKICRQLEENLRMTSFDHMTRSQTYPLIAT